MIGVGYLLDEVDGLSRGLIFFGVNTCFIGVNLFLNEYYFYLLLSRTGISFCGVFLRLLPVL
ncbi:hypothetical protein DXB41_16630 [Segatella copri]|nr:hypothetical protein DXB41_16630 [Segatella copri]